ncbi:venom allergen 5-like [Lutzomyia longipalpis]|uniref:venom allergen 5-like n=1 Tax=Lutzomyia longipalpis TaxID=7200 RepID=UPI002483CA61|nr:venom allergen 5-like [Lutzomyia longipalpis]
MWKFVIFLFVGVGAQSNINWCNMKTQYCRGLDHIACEPNNFPYATGVRNIQIVPMTDAIKTAIVDRHNFYRSRIAKAGESGVPGAAKMEKMVWNNDLAYVAEQHAKHANFQHDDCRSFTTFPNSGQNLASGSSSAPFSSLVDNIQTHIDLWYGEVAAIKDKLKCIDSFTLTDNCLDAGHFTVMVKDVNNAVGCSAVTFEQQYGTRWFYSLLTTCNYADTNVINQRIYNTGTSCSACASVKKSCESSSGLCV